MGDRLHFYFLNAGHFLDHLFLLIFATAAALVIGAEWGMSYSQLIPYATPGLIAFGLFSLPSGWLADRWSREGMMLVFFVGIGLSATVTAFAQSPLQLAAGLFLIGIFASIYHPVGLAMIARGDKSMGLDIAINGVWGNMGVAVAALLTGFLIDQVSWRFAFAFPGLVSFCIGLAYFYRYRGRVKWRYVKPSSSPVTQDSRSLSGPNMGASTSEKRSAHNQAVALASAIVLFTTAVASITFQGTTFALPKVFEERLSGIALNATDLGIYTFIVFAVASVAQIVAGKMLDRYGPRNVFISVALFQMLFFLLMPGQIDLLALLIALGFMLGTFSQTPINDYMIGKMAKSELRATVYGVRYIISFAVWAAVVPLIAWVHLHWGFDVLFLILAACAALILLAVLKLPNPLPTSSAT